MKPLLLVFSVCLGTLFSGCTSGEWAGPEKTNPERTQQRIREIEWRQTIVDRVRSYKVGVTKQDEFLLDSGLANIQLNSAEVNSHGYTSKKNWRLFGIKVTMTADKGTNMEYKIGDPTGSVALLKFDNGLLTAVDFR